MYCDYYIKLISINKQNKDLSNAIHLTIVGNIHKNDKFCTLKYKGTNKLYPDSFSIPNLINSILRGRVFVSNISKLEHWNFNQRSIKVTKKDYSEQNVRSIINKNWQSYNGKVQLKSSDIVLYHGSKSGIVGDIQPCNTRHNCDFGVGFYTGGMKEQAQLFIRDNGSAKLLYKLGVNLQGLNIYEFDDVTTWVLYIMCKRGHISCDKYKKLSNLVNYIDSFDVVVGLIADDEMFKVFNDFSEGALTIEGLAYCLSKVNLGKQYVFKTNKACRQIKYLDITQLSKEDSSKLSSMHNPIKKVRETVVEEAKELYEYGIRRYELLRRYE